MRFGNTFDHLRRGVILGLLVGLVSYVFSASMIVFYEKLPLGRLLPLTVILIIPPLALLLGIGPTLMFSIHLVDGWVEHRFLDRWTLSRAKISDFAAMQRPAGVFAAKLTFTDGTQMRIWGAHLGILENLESTLRQSAES